MIVLFIYCMVSTKAIKNVQNRHLFDKYVVVIYQLYTCLKHLVSIIYFNLYLRSFLNRQILQFCVIPFVHWYNCHINLWMLMKMKNKFDRKSSSSMQKKCFVSLLMKNGKFLFVKCGYFTFEQCILLYLTNNSKRVI